MHIRVTGPDTELIQLLCAVVVEVVTRKCLVFERPWAKTTHIIISIQKDQPRSTLVACLEPQKPPIVIRPAPGSMVIFPPLKELGRSFARSRVKNGVLPSGNVNRSRPARRVEVASMRMLLLSVREKYPGDASL